MAGGAGVGDALGDGSAEPARAGELAVSSAVATVTAGTNVAGSERAGCIAAQGITASGASRRRSYLPEPLRIFFSSAKNSSISSDFV